MQNRIDIIPANLKYRDAIVSLLQSEKLPVADLPPTLDNFLVAVDNGLVAGGIGLEIYERNGLLRSLVVKPEYRKMKIASALVHGLEEMAKGMGLEAIYLLTETAQQYFYNKEYKEIDRNDTPASLKKSSEFSHVCPATAILMRKKI